MLWVWLPWGLLPLLGSPWATALLLQCQVGALGAFDASTLALPRACNNHNCQHDIACNHVSV